MESVNSNLERHHMVRITRSNGCQAHMPQRLSLSGMSRYHLGACPATTYVRAPLILMGLSRYHLGAYLTTPRGMPCYHLGDTPL